jgi:hypothetical protein
MFIFFGKNVFINNIYDMIHLITYGSCRFATSRERLYNEAVSTGWFDSVTKYTEDDLDVDFKKHFKSILSESRGGGYWIWKPYLIRKKLGELSDNDILIYLDAGCSINTLGKNRFNEYIELLNNVNASIISFQMVHEEKKYTTKEIFTPLKI